MIVGITALRHAGGILLMAACTAAAAAGSTTMEDFSHRLDALWDFDHPAQSEERFRAEAAIHPPRSREAAEALTQQARAQGLQQHFGQADATLYAIESALRVLPARVRVRYLIERGRLQNSSGRALDACTWFEQALTASKDDLLPGAAYYRVDALHMLAIASPADQQLEWHRRALAAADAADDERTRNWRASLLHNLGWTMHESGDYSLALDYWRQALVLREAAKDIGRIRIARWTLARGLRSLGRLDEAEAMQRALADELAAARAPDGYVFEELAEIAFARGDRAGAGPWAAQALAILREDAGLRANDAARLARLAELAGSAPAGAPVPGAP